MNLIVCAQKPREGLDAPHNFCTFEWTFCITKMRKNPWYNLYSFFFFLLLRLSICKERLEFTQKGFAFGPQGMRLTRLGDRLAKSNFVSERKENFFHRKWSSKCLFWAFQNRHKASAWQRRLEVSCPSKSCSFYTRVLVKAGAQNSGSAKKRERTISGCAKIGLGKITGA